MIEPDGTLRTSDLSFAAVLASRGVSLTLTLVEGKGRPVGVWSVEAAQVDQKVLDLASAYENDLCLVEPKRFIRKVSSIRRELYAMLDHDGEPGTRIRQN